MALHEQSIGATDEWYTPPHVFEALGCFFHVDVASPGQHIVPWIPADNYYTAKDDGLSLDWYGRVWMNPPFGGRNALTPWLRKFFTHANGIALTPDRTSAPWWQEFAPHADLILFVAPKLKFIGPDGKPGSSPAQGTCLMAKGEASVQALKRAAAERLGRMMKPVR